MPVHFTSERMTKVLDSHAGWWDGSLDRPLVAVTLKDAYAVSRRAKAPPLSQATCADFSHSPEALIDALDEELSACEFLGDAYPRVNFDAFGPGVLAAFCGARLDNSSGSVWFFPDKPMALEDIHPHYDPENPWARRIKDIYRAGLARWGGLVQMGMPDLGGVLDVAAVFRGSENLLMDLYDDPEGVLALCADIQDAWRAAYADMASVLHPALAGYTDWSGLLSKKPSYIIQCDFSYMIGSGMFAQFALPTLAKDVQWLTRSIYHLDGIGELKHLDMLLALDKLDAVQWVFGDGQPGTMHWLDIYRRIKGAGKRMMLLGEPQEMLSALDALGSKGVYISMTAAGKRQDAVKALLAMTA